MIIHNPILTGSFSVNGADLSTITGSVATSASFDARTTYLESTSSILTAASASQSVTSGSLVAASASLSATSGSLSAASGSFNTRVSALEATGSALSSSLLTVSGSGYATSGSLNTRVTALEATGSALSSSLLTVSGSGYATSASLSAASGSFNTRVATIESKYATTGSNTFIDTQVVSGSILQSGSFTSTGTLTAQTLVIQTITSSVVYSSGSNVFGNSLGNSQVFTGSVLITGSLTIAGASSATSYSGVTIYGSSVACSPIGCFATSCATSFVGGTMSGTTIYGSTAVCGGTISGTTIYGSTAVCSANGLLIGNGGVTATCNYLPKFTGASIIGNSQVFDNGTNVGIGTITPNGKLTINSTGDNNIRLENGSELAIIRVLTTGALDIWSHGDTANEIFFRQGTGSGTVKMTLDASGNLGLGVTPSAWGAGSFAFQTQGGAVWSFSSAYMDIWQNSYYNGTSSIYTTTAAASFYRQAAGSHEWNIAPSGTAGCTITWTNGMTLTNGGNVGIGTTTPDRKLDIACANASDTKLVIRTACGFAGSYSPSLDFHVGGYESTCTTGQIKMCGTNNYSGDMIFSTQLSGTINPLVERMRISCGGNVGIGTTSPGTLLQVSPGASYANNPTIQVIQSYADGYDAILSLTNCHTGGRNWSIRSTNNSQGNFGGCKLVFQDTTAGSSTSVMTLVAGGNVGIGTSSPFAIADVNLTVNGPTGAAIQLGYNGTRYGQFYAANDEVRLSAVANLPLTFYSNNLERMRFTGTGIACFACQVCAPSAVFSKAADQVIRVETTSATDNSRIDFITPSKCYTIQNLQTGAANSLIFYDLSASAERMRITCAGVLLINNNYASPYGVLNTYKTPVASNYVDQIVVQGTGNYPSLRLGTYDAYDGVIATTGNDLRILAGLNVTTEDHNIMFYTSFNGGTTGAQNYERMRITYGGDIRMDATSGSKLVTVKGATGNGNYGELRLGNADHSAGIRGCHISSGNVDLEFWTEAYSAGGYQKRMTITSAGITCFGFTVCAPCFATISDYRMKSNIRPIEGLSIIMNTKPYKFEYNYDCSTSFGMIAHELQDTVPEAVFGYKDGEVMQGVDYMKLLPITIKAIQELNTKFEEYKTTHP